MRHGLSLYRLKIRYRYGTVFGPRHLQVLL